MFLVSWISNKCKSSLARQRTRRGKNNVFVDELCLAMNPAFVFNNPDAFRALEIEYKNTAGLYYAGQPSLSDIAAKIAKHIEKL